MQERAVDSSLALSVAVCVRMCLHLFSCRRHARRQPCVRASC
jgi:hypothetical protein